MKKKILCAFFVLLFLSSCVTSQVSYEELKSETVSAYSENSTQIIVKSDIPKVSIFLNGVFQGTTNLTLNDLREGVYILRAEKDGFETQNFSIEVENGESRSFFVELPEIPAAQNSVSQN